MWLVSFLVPAWLDVGVGELLALCGARRSQGAWVLGVACVHAQALVEEELAIARMRKEKLAAAGVAAGGRGAACTVCKTCKGFEPDVFKPKLCHNCRHPRNRHQ